MKENICIVGSGNWGSAIAKILGNNIQAYPDTYEQTIRMWVYEEKIDGELLTEIINKKHENVKYLPGIKLPENIVAVPNIVEAVKDATILVIVIPHQFVEHTCKQIAGHIRKDAKAISLVKGLDSSKGISFFSEIIKKILKIDVSVLMGANVANEVAAGKFCEATIGTKDKNDGIIFKQMFNCDTFSISVTDDVIGTELCGALKNIIALAAGFSDGLDFGSNTKAALIRIGLLEMKRFAQIFYPTVKSDTFFESCGVADLITSCYGGRNRKVAEAFVRTKKPFSVLEKEMLNGQKLQGTLTVQEVYEYLKEKNLENKFPLMTKIYKISFEGMDPNLLFSGLASQPNM